MTKYDRDLTRSPQSIPADLGSFFGSLEGSVTDMFEASLQAHELAVHSQKNFSEAELYESGTWQKYEQRAKALARKHPSRDPFLAYSSNEEHSTWSSRNNQQSYRSALVRLAARDILELAPSFWLQTVALAGGEDEKRKLVQKITAGIDEETQDRIRQVSKALSNSQMCKLERAIGFIIAFPPDPDHTAVRRKSRTTSPATTNPGPSASKRSTLYKLNRHQRRKARVYPDYNWRDQFWSKAVMSDTYVDDHRRAFIAALMLIGCRPSEFCDDLGVTVAAVKKGDKQHLAFEIIGAKCANGGDIHPGKGQERRYIEITCQTREALWLSDYVDVLGGGPVRLCLNAPTHDQEGIELMPTERRRRVTNQLDKLICRLGKVAFPRLRSNLSPYVFRHALSSDLRAPDHHSGRGDIAAGLGHQSERTQTRYGSPNTAKGLTGSRAKQITALSATSPVRTFDRSRLGRRPDVGPE